MPDRTLTREEMAIRLAALREARHAAGYASPPTAEQCCMVLDRLIEDAEREMADA